jgi:GTP-sensing pleiotropic transcriptional regulator CodY
MLHIANLNLRVWTELRQIDYLLASSGFVISTKRKIFGVRVGVGCRSSQTTSQFSEQDITDYFGSEKADLLFLSERISRCGQVHDMTLISSRGNSFGL